MGFAKMNEQEQALKLSALYKELAEKGTHLQFDDGIKDTNWIDAKAYIPDMTSNLDLFRVAEKQDKIIDMSCLVGSDIDCELGYPAPYTSGYTITKLKVIVEERGEIKYNNGCQNYSTCRVRQDHWHSWQGGDKCPLPEGLDCKFKFRGLHDAEGYSHSVNSDNSWQHTDSDLDIIAFKVLGIAEGYKYE